MKRIYFVCLVLFVSFVNLWSQVFTPEEVQILKYQDERTFGANNELFTYLDNRNDAVVTRTLWAIGNIGNKDGITVVAEKLFSSHTDAIRVAAAYSLGLLPFDESRNSLVEALNTEKNAGVLSEIINSLGYVGNKDNYEEVVSFKTDSEELRAYIAVS
jgi:HEAT repeat protein